MNLLEMTQAAKIASRELRNVSFEQRNAILKDFADDLLKEKEKILQANTQDYQEAKENGMKESMLDRLLLTEERIQSMALGIQDVIALEDPLHKVLEERILSSGIHLKKVSVPFGVIGILFESRPNVTADCAALCIKSGNACVLKGGKESYRSCKSIVDILKRSLQKNGISMDVIMLGEKPSHEEVERWMGDKENLDLLIPRGSKRLIQSVVDHAKVPVIETGAGVCHVFVDESADFVMAKEIVINAKTQRPSVCNAMETLLVHEAIAKDFIPYVMDALKEKKVIVYGDERSRQYDSFIKKLDKDGYYTEYGDLEMNLKVVDNIQQAIFHIETYGTHHSECIVTKDAKNVEKFFNSIDSACVYHNASTRWTDGFEFGLGAEIGISTQKLHARGPMGLKELTTYMYQLEGNGEIR